MVNRLWACKFLHKYIVSQFNLDHIEYIQTDEPIEMVRGLSVFEDQEKYQKLLFNIRWH